MVKAQIVEDKFLFENNLEIGWKVQDCGFFSKSNRDIEGIQISLWIFGSITNSDSHGASVVKFFLPFNFGFQ